jgi:hypothetical protein
MKKSMWTGALVRREAWRYMQNEGVVALWCETSANMSARAAQAAPLGGGMFSID